MIYFLMEFVPNKHVSLHLHNMICKLGLLKGDFIYWRKMYCYIFLLFWNIEKSIFSLFIIVFLCNYFWHEIVDSSSNM